MYPKGTRRPSTRNFKSDRAAEYPKGTRRPSTRNELNQTLPQVTRKVHNERTPGSNQLYQVTSVQFKKVSTRSEKPISAPPRLSEAAPSHLFSRTMPGTTPPPSSTKSTTRIKLGLGHPFSTGPPESSQVGSASLILLAHSFSTLLANF